MCKRITEHTAYEQSKTCPSEATIWLWTNINTPGCQTTLAGADVVSLHTSRVSISFCRLKRSHTSGGRRGIFPLAYSQCISERFSSNDGSFPSWRRRNLHPFSSQLTKSPIKFKKWEHKKQMNRWQMRGNIFRQNAVNKSKGCVCLCSVILCVTQR